MLRLAFCILFLALLQPSFADKYYNTTTPPPQSTTSNAGQSSSDLVALSSGAAASLVGPVQVTSLTTSTLAGPTRSTTTLVAVEPSGTSSQPSSSNTPSLVNPAPTQRVGLQAVAALVMAAGFAVLMS